MLETRDQTPLQIGPYRIIESLGKGGMGIVYRGQHCETGQLAAVKTVRTYKRAGHGTDMFGREDRKGDLTKALISWAKSSTK